MEKETKRILLLILETMKEQQGRYPVDGLADRIERIAHQSAISNTSRSNTISGTRSYERRYPQAASIVPMKSVSSRRGRA
jgi:hypothetical protein